MAEGEKEDHLDFCPDHPTKRAVSENLTNLTNSTLFF